AQHFVFQKASVGRRLLHRGPSNERADLLNVWPRLGADRMQEPSPNACLLEDKMLRIDLPAAQIVLCPKKGFHVAGRQAELVHRTDCAASAAGLMGPKQSIASNDAAEIAEAVILVLYRRTCEGSNAHQFV